ncbi:MAG TPA: YlbF family regulator, partial [Gemmatimonadales bacterium]
YGPIWARALPARAEERYTVIWDKAQDLGRLIGQSAEYQALRRAETSLREDKETVAKLDQIQTLARKVDQVVSTGQMPDQATAEAYENAVRDLEMSPTGQAYVVARANFEKLMQKVNQQISEGMDKGSASSIITLG